MWKRLLRFTGFKLGLILTLVFCLFKILLTRYESTQNDALEFVSNIEYAVMDFKVRIRGGPETEAERQDFQRDSHVVIVAVDEKSHRMKDLGLWPWPRNKTARLIQNLIDCKAKVIGFDMVFAEPDISRAAPLIEEIQQHYATSQTQDPEFEAYLKEFHDSASGDAQMAQVLEASDNVVLGYFFFIRPEEVAQLDREEVVEKGMDSIGFGTFAFVKSIPGMTVLNVLPQAYGVRANLPMFTDAVEYYGFFNQIPDSDSVFRRVPMVYSFVPDDRLDAVRAGKELPELFPALSLQVLSLYYKKPANLYIHTTDGQEVWKNLVGLYLGPPGNLTDEHMIIPVEDLGMFRINFYGPEKTFRHVSAGDVIHKEPEACRAVEDKVVLVGATTTGIYDLRPTPFQPDFPGVELHANVIENVIRKDFLVRHYGIGMLEALAMLVLGVGLSWLLNRIRLTIGLVITLLIIAAVVLTDYFLVFGHGYVAYLVLPTIHIFTLFLGIAVWRYATEERQKRETRRAFQFYLSADVIDSVLEDTSKLGLGGERRELTVLFSDIRGFTTISEALPPEELTALLNEYLTPMTDLVFKYRGTLDKYMGDAIMAFYGAPIAFPDHARAACRTALEMMAKLHEMQASWHERGLPEIDIGIGLNTGVMSVGNMGSVNRFDYTVMGDHVNLGSRLEGINKQYGTNIIVSQFTRAAIGDHFTCRELDSVAVKGKKEPVQIFELCHSGPPTAEDAWMEQFHEALAAYRAQRWDEASAAFAALAEARDDHPSKIYVERCKDMRESPPGADWDGVFKMKTK